MVITNGVPVPPFEQAAGASPACRPEYHAQAVALHAFGSVDLHPEVAKHLPVHAPTYTRVSYALILDEVPSDESQQSSYPRRPAGKQGAASKPSPASIHCQLIAKRR